ncbi:MAG: hypothetical protein OCU22_06890 [Canidatus Methanoxibalbensis ujae]|nr:hypothetical protein [Candidatus Methanoxibalbensis ujae]
MRRNISIIAIIAICISAAVAVHAQPKIERVSDLIVINADPESVQVGGFSTITITVYYPEDYPLVGGEPAVTRVDVSTDIGTLIDAENETNRGKDITVYTVGGNATVLITSTEPGIANVTAEAPQISDMLNLRDNNTIYRVENSTTVIFQSGETPASPSPTTNVTPTVSPFTSPNATPAGTPPAESPMPTETPQTPSPTSTQSPTSTPSPASTPSPTSTPSHTPSTPPAGGIPGFSAMLAVVSLIAVAYMLLSRAKQ